MISWGCPERMLHSAENGAIEMAEGEALKTMSSQLIGYGCSRNLHTRNLHTQERSYNCKKCH